MFIKQHWIGALGCIPHGVKSALTLAIILVLAAALRCWQIRESLWLDELHTAWVAAGPWDEIIARAQLGNQAPPFFLISWIACRLYGMQELALRLPSLIAGLGVVVVAFKLTLEWTRSLPAALLVSSLVAFDSNCIFYSQEARPYASVQLLGLIHIAVFWRVQSDGSSMLRACLVASGIGLFWLHYTTALLLVAEVFYFSLRQLSQPNRAYGWRHLRFDFGLIAMAMLPSSLHLWEIARHRHDWAQFVQQSRLWAIFDWLSLLEYIAAPLCVTLFIVAWQTQLSRRIILASFSGSPLFFLLTILTVPISIAWAATETDLARLSLGRYIVVIAVLPPLFAGVCLARIENRFWQIAACLLVLAIALQRGGVCQRVWNEGLVLNDRRQNWRAAVAVLNQGAKEQQPVFVRSGFLEADRSTILDDPLQRSYCLAPVNSIYLVPHSSRKIVPLSNARTNILSAEAMDIIERHREAFLLINASAQSHALIESDIRENLLARGMLGLRIDVRHFGSVRLLHVIWKGSLA